MLNIDRNFIEKQNENEQGQIEISYDYKFSNIQKSLSQDFDSKPIENDLSKIMLWTKSQIRSLFVFAKKKMSSLKPIRIPIKSTTSFQFSKPKYFPSRVPYVFNNLRGHDLIDKETHPDQLQAVFQNTNITKPIRWTQKESNLYYFIKQLIKRGIIVDPKKEIWKKTIACFVDEQGELFLTDVLRGSKPTKQSPVIDSIVRKFQI